MHTEVSATLLNNNKYTTNPIWLFSAQRKAANPPKISPRVGEMDAIPRVSFSDAPHSIGNSFCSNRS